MAISAACLFQLSHASAHEGEHPKQAFTDKEQHRPTPLPDRVVLTWSGDPTNFDRRHLADRHDDRRPGRRVRPGRQPGRQSERRRVPQSQRIAGSKQSFRPISGTCHINSVRLEGLEPATMYAYRVGDGGPLERVVSIPHGLRIRRAVYVRLFRRRSERHSLALVARDSRGQSACAAGRVHAARRRPDQLRQQRRRVGRVVRRRRLAQRHDPRRRHARQSRIRRRRRPLAPLAAAVCVSDERPVRPRRDRLLVRLPGRADHLAQLQRANRGAMRLAQVGARRREPAEMDDRHVPSPDLLGGQGTRQSRTPRRVATDFRRARRRPGAAGPRSRLRPLGSGRAEKRARRRSHSRAATRSTSSA